MRCKVMKYTVLEIEREYDCDITKENANKFGYKIWIAYGLNFVFAVGRTLKELVADIELEINKGKEMISRDKINLKRRWGL